MKNFIVIIVLAISPIPTYKWSKCVKMIPVHTDPRTRLKTLYYARQASSLWCKETQRDEMITVLFFETHFQKVAFSGPQNAVVVGLGDISHAICMRISSVKPVLWLAVNLHHLFSNGAAFNTQSRKSLTSDAISRSLSQMNRLRYERDIASLDLRLCVLNAAPFENRWWRLTANQRTGFTDEMRMHIAWDISPSPTLSCKWTAKMHKIFPCLVENGVVIAKRMLELHSISSPLSFGC